MKKKGAPRAAAVTKLYRIHPAIGIARLGNAEADDFFIGPETPGLPATGEPPGTAVPPFKNANGAIKQQGARFRVFEYVQVQGKVFPNREIDLNAYGVEDIEWTVHLANRKASFHEFDGEKGEKSAPAPRRNRGVAVDELEIDPGARCIAGREVYGVRFTPGTSSAPAKERWPRYPKRHRERGKIVIDYLGELRTDNAGRLIILGGKGKSASNAVNGPAPLDTYANNDTWFDDISDGPVTAEITFRGADGGKVKVQAAGAWVLVGPPDFAPQIGNVISLYDVLYDLAAREMQIPANDILFDGSLRRLKRINEILKSTGAKSLDGYVADFNEEIFPILQKAINARWVYAPAKSAHAKMGVGGEGGHGHMGAAHDHGVALHKHETEQSIWPVLSDPGPDGQEAREFVFGALRPLPGFNLPKGGMGDMPRLFGDEYDREDAPRSRLTLPLTHYLLIKLWSEGKFSPPDDVPLAPPTVSAITPDGLDRAALENCVGGAFFPGIETGWQIRHTKLFTGPFRINLNATSTYFGEKGKIKAGHFSRQMALPWQADFNDCAREGEGEEEFGWWPTQRPDDVFKNADAVSAKKTVPWARATRHAKWPSGGKLPSHEEMKDNWFKFGFVVRRGADFVETERAPQVP